MAPCSLSAPGWVQAGVRCWLQPSEEKLTAPAAQLYRVLGPSGCCSAWEQHGGAQGEMDGLLQDMGQGGFPVPMKAGQQWYAGLSSEPFPASPWRGSGELH